MPSTSCMIKEFSEETPTDKIFLSKILHLLKRRNKELKKKEKKRRLR
jgi:hypothetical protein